jgi:putative NADH-flavin reductase
MQITVFGASGKVGRLVVHGALARGYKVVAFVHSHDPFEKTDKLKVVKGDIYRGQDVAKALKGSRVVVSCLGSWGRKTASGNRNVLTSAMLEILPAMKTQKIERIVTLTGSGALAPNATPSRAHRWFMRLTAPFPAGKVFKDGETHMKLLQGSGLAWTTVRSPLMNNKNNAKYKLNGGNGNHYQTISRQAVASAIVDQLESLKWLHKAPVISRAKK